MSGVWSHEQNRIYPSWGGYNYDHDRIERNNRLNVYQKKERVRQRNEPSFAKLKVYKKHTKNGKRR